MAVGDRLSMAIMMCIATGTVGSVFLLSGFRKQIAADQRPPELDELDKLKKSL